MPNKNVTVNKSKMQREMALAADRREILDAPPEKSLDLIAEHPFPVTLVQSMAEEDLYQLIHAIGLDDAYPGLALASNQQGEYLLEDS